MTIQELVNAGEIRVGEINCTTEFRDMDEFGQVTEEEYIEKIRERRARTYVGAVVLKPDDQIPEEVGVRCWAERLYTDANSGSCSYDHEARKLVHSTPPLWIVVWTTEETESAFRAAKQAENCVDLDTFHMMRSAGIEEKG